MSLSQVVNQNASTVIVDDIAKALELRESEAPYQLVESSVKPITDFYKDIAKAEVTSTLLPDGKTFVNRIVVTKGDSKSVTLRVFHRSGKDTLLDAGPIDPKKLSIGTCTSDGKLITDTMVAGGQRYEVARIYAVVD